jgi:hypothetical protein
MQPAKSAIDSALVEEIKGGMPAAEAGAANINKIRDILFGAHIKDYDARFRRLEESLLAQTTEIRETAKLRADAFETYVKKELEALQARLKTEREERCEDIRQQARDLKDLSEALYQKLRDMSDHSSESERQTREQILQQSKDLLDEMRARQNEMTALLDRRSSDLASAKTDRTMLAALFTEAAMRLNDEFKIPGAEG